MKELTKALLISFGITAILLFVCAGCSDNGKVTDTGDDKTNDEPNSYDEQVPGDDQGPDRVGPPEYPDDEFQIEHFTFDDAVPVTMATEEKTIGATGGTITVIVDGQERSFTIPARFADLAGNVTVTVSKGTNLYGDNLETYDLWPSNLAYAGPIELELVTDVTVLASMWTDPNFDLYSQYGDAYIAIASANPDQNGLVSFMLNRSTTYAVVYRGHNADENRGAN
jgi:hypothetical protein